MILCGTKNGSSMASLEEAFEAPLFLRLYDLDGVTRFIVNRSVPLTVSTKGNIGKQRINQGSLSVGHSRHDVGGPTNWDIA